MDLEIDIQVRQGDFVLDTELHLTGSAVGVFGHSGCGKSTLLRCIAGLTRPRSGRIVLNGEVLFDSARRVWVPPHKRRIGMVFQDARLFPHWTVGQNLKAGEKYLEPSDKPYSEKQVTDLLRIGPLLKRSVANLSGGEKQRVALARALLAYPRLLLMDEPVSGLDAALKKEILPFLCAVHRELCVPCILVSHDLPEILQMTDSLVLLEGGCVKGRGTLPELVKDPDILRLFRGSGLMNMLLVCPVEHCGRTKLTTLSFPGASGSRGCMRAEHWSDLPLMNPVIVGIASSEIALALNPVEGVSLQNQICGIVTHLIETRDRSLCIVDVGCPLMVEITAQSVHELGLRPGREVRCLFKACAVQRF